MLSGSNMAWPDNQTTVYYYYVIFFTYRFYDVLLYSNFYEKGIVIKHKTLQYLTLIKWMCFEDIKEILYSSNTDL